LKILKKDGTEPIASDQVTASNYLVEYFLFSMQRFFERQAIASQVNYPYRCMIEAVLMYSKEAQQTLLSNGTVLPRYC